jgi:hypothetical protein
MTTLRPILGMILGTILGMILGTSREEASSR